MIEGVRSAAGRSRGVTVASAVAIAGVTAGLSPVVASAAGRSQTTAARRADHAAVVYLDRHHRGACRPRVLRTEADVEHGVPVFDVRTAAANGTVYVVHVRRSNDGVLTVSRAESQTGGGCAAAPRRRSVDRHRSS